MSENRRKIDNASEYLSQKNAEQIAVICELLSQTPDAKSDVTAIAKRLIHEFGSLKNAAAMPTKLLVNKLGIHENTAILISMVGGIANTMKNNNLLPPSNVLCSFHKLSEYAIYMYRTDALSDRSRECGWIIYVGDDMRVIDYYGFRSDDGKHLRFSQADALRFKPISQDCGVFIVHTHPDGSVSPSREDLAVTKSMLGFSENLNEGIKLLDSIIVNDVKAYSILYEREFIVK